MQETGRAGRDDLPATAELYSGVKVSASHISEKMEYCKLIPESCRRIFLLQEFDTSTEVTQAIISACKCCDLCSLNCNCNSCKIE